MKKKTTQYQDSKTVVKMIVVVTMILNKIEVTMTQALTQTKITKNTYLMKTIAEKIDTHKTSPAQTVFHFLKGPSIIQTMMSMILIMTKEKTIYTN